MIKIVRLASLAAWLGLSAVSAWAAPVLYASDGNALERNRQALRDGSSPLADVVRSHLEQADKLLEMKPVSVMDKQMVPPSGDKRDYASLSPYWWPDPTKPDGVPYVRRDGEFNPERANYDLEPMDRMTRAVDQLGLAYYLSGDEKYAAKAAELVRVWFLNPETRMNPNLKFAQFVPGYTEPRPSGVIEGTRFRRVIDGIGLISGSRHWSDADDAALRAWFGEMLEYLTTSEQGLKEAAQSNNHATWYHVQVGAFALFAGKPELASELIERPFKTMISEHLTSEGLQPEEAARTLSFHYHRYNLLGLVDLATLGDRVGLDLWNYQSADGKSLRLAIDFLIPYALQEKPWTHQQIRPARFDEMAVILRRAANAYGEPRYEAAAEQLRQDDRRPMIDLLYPSALTTH